MLSNLLEIMKVADVASKNLVGRPRLNMKVENDLERPNILGSSSL